jgi:hypothetical protein
MPSLSEEVLSLATAVKDLLEVVNDTMDRVKLLEEIVASHSRQLRR